MKQHEITIIARWDDASGVWAATSKDVPGLATWAETIPELEERLKIAIPELLELNGAVPGKSPLVPFHLLMRGERVLVAHLA